MNRSASILVRLRILRLFIDHPCWMIQQQDASVSLTLLTILDIFLFNTSLVVVFWYFCMAAARCENMVRKISISLLEID